MRDQVQVRLYCRADPLLLWLRSSRVTHWAPPIFNFRDVSQEQRQLHRFFECYLVKWDDVVTELHSKSNSFLPCVWGKCTELHLPHHCRCKIAAERL